MQQKKMKIKNPLLIHLSLPFSKHQYYNRNKISNKSSNHDIRRFQDRQSMFEHHLTPSFRKRIQFKSKSREKLSILQQQIIKIENSSKGSDQSHQNITCIEKKTNEDINKINYNLCRAVVELNKIKPYLSQNLEILSKQRFEIGQIHKQIEKIFDIGKAMEIDRELELTQGKIDKLKTQIKSFNLCRIKKQPYKNYKSIKDQLHLKKKLYYDYEIKETTLDLKIQKYQTLIDQLPELDRLARIYQLIQRKSSLATELRIIMVYYNAKQTQQNCSIEKMKKKIDSLSMFHIDKLTATTQPTQPIIKNSYQAPSIYSNKFLRQKKRNKTKPELETSHLEPSNTIKMNLLRKKHHYSLHKESQYGQ